MTHNELTDILRHSSGRDWLQADGGESYVFKQDLHLKIKSGHGFEVKDTSAYPWLDDLDEKSLLNVQFDVVYGASVIEKRSLLLVDGGRALLPIPSGSDGRSVSEVDLSFARIVDDSEIVMAYMRRCGLAVDPPSADQ